MEKRIGSTEALRNKCTSRTIWRIATVNHNSTILYFYSLNCLLVEVPMASTEAIEMGAAVICSQIEDSLKMKRGCIIGRNGTIELSAILYYRKHGKFFIDHLPTLERNAGVFPLEGPVLKRWADEYLEANRICEIIAAGWYKPLEKQELEFLAAENKGAYSSVPLRSLEPYYVDKEKRWTRLLAGRKVCVVSSFTDTIEKQLEQRHMIWGSDTESLLPTTAQFSFVKTGYAPVLAQGSGEWSSCSTWKEAVDQVEATVLRYNAEIVLIGCGGLGFPLAQRLKKSGKVVIVLGGAIQVLFGIKGERWRNHSVISRFWNSHWVYPSIHETPNGAKAVENACYWKS